MYYLLTVRIPINLAVLALIFWQFYMILFK